MVRATQPYLVPAEDQADDHFFVPLSTQRLMVKLPLDANKVETVLRPLALWLNFPGAPTAKKVALLAGIQENLSLIPMADATARWPCELGPIPTSSALQQVRLSILRDADDAKTFPRASTLYIKTLRRDTPEFIPHLHVKMNELEAAIRTARAECRPCTEQKAWETRYCAAPKWLASALPQPLTGVEYYEIILEEEEDGETKERRAFLPVEGWSSQDLDEKMSWLYGCSCSDYIMVRMRSWIRVWG